MLTKKRLLSYERRNEFSSEKFEEYIKNLLNS